MARILDLELYPLKDTPSRDDYVIGTDVENGDRTVSFSLGSIADLASSGGGLPTSFYEQGTYTPVLTGISSQANLSGTYVRIGNQTHFRIYATNLQGTLTSVSAPVVSDGVGTTIISEVIYNTTSEGTAFDPSKNIILSKQVGVTTDTFNLFDKISNSTTSITLNFQNSFISISGIIITNTYTP